MVPPAGDAHAAPPGGAAFITSAPRKRKEPEAGGASPAPREKRAPDSPPQHGLALSPAEAAALAAAGDDVAALSAAADAAAAGGADAALFSPGFHLLLRSRLAAAVAAAGGGGGGGAAAASPRAAAGGAAAGGALTPQPGGEPLAPCGGDRPGTPALEAVSTDASTGTSASLVEVDSDCEPAAGAGVGAGARAAARALAAVPALPLAPAAPPQPDDGEDEEDELEDFDPLLFIKRLPPLEECVPLPRTSFLLPRRTRRSKLKTLVLDLDETLVHSTLDGDGGGGGPPADFTFPVEVGAVRHMVGVRRRPHLQPFLARCAQLFEVVVFTASQRVYAEQLLDVVDPGRALIRHRVFRESCVFWEGNYLKDLTALGRDLAHTLIVDNSPQAFGFQVDNGVPIESWFDDDDDDELLKLLPFLERVATADDVRPHIRDEFRLREQMEALAAK